MFTQKNFILLTLLIITIVGCQTAETKTVEVEVTRIIEVPEEIEVTRIVEVLVETEAAETETTESPNILPGFPTDVRTYHSEITDHDYIVYVIVPDTYEALNKTYPTVYVLDGDLFAIPTAVTAGILALGGEMPEVITVGIGYGGTVGNSLQRRRADLHDHNSFEPFLQFLQEELIPDIEANYRVEPSDRALISISSGGTFVLYALFNAPDTFNKIVAVSPSSGYLTYEKAYAEDHDALPARLFMSVGEFDTVPSIEHFDDALQSSNYDDFASKLVILDGETHMSTQPRAYATGLKWVFSEEDD